LALPNLAKSCAWPCNQSQIFQTIVGKPIDAAKPRVNAASEAKFQLAYAGFVALRKDMRNPDSFKLEEALIMDKTGAVCYTYQPRMGLVE
jgi:hypothetical protein